MGCPPRLEYKLNRPPQSRRKSHHNFTSTAVWGPSAMICVHPLFSPPAASSSASGVSIGRRETEALTFNRYQEITFEEMRYVELEEDRDGRRCRGAARGRDGCHTAASGSARGPYRGGSDRRIGRRRARGRGRRGSALLWTGLLLWSGPLLRPALLDPARAVLGRLGLARPPRPRLR